MSVIVLRIVGFVLLAIIGGALIASLVTGNRRWLKFAFQIFKYAVIFAAIVLVFLALERLVLVL